LAFANALGRPRLTGSSEVTIYTIFNLNALQASNEFEAPLTRDVANLMAPARALGLPKSSGPLNRDICVTRSPGAKRKLAMRMLESSCPMLHPV
jgi:hypothetical protein